MTTYNAAAVSNSAIAFEKPVTLQQGRALRDNPIAMAEAVAGAPKFAKRVRGGAATGTGSITFTGLEDYSGADMFIQASATAGGTVTWTLVVEFSNDGTTWLTGATLYTATGTTASFNARVWVDFATATYYVVNGVTYSTGTATNASTSAVSMRLRSSGAALNFSASVEFNGGIV